VSPQAGFTLIEVLVALAIIAVAMSAAVRVAGLMTQSSGVLRDRSIAMIAAQTRMAELQLEGRLPTGVKAVDCDLGRLSLRCEQVIAAAEMAAYSKSPSKSSTATKTPHPSPPGNPIKSPPVGAAEGCDL
jgi:general secretion pathway protein I